MSGTIRSIGSYLHVVGAPDRNNFRPCLLHGDGCCVGDSANTLDGEAFLEHSCDEWNIGREKEIEEMILALQAALIASRSLKP